MERREDKNTKRNHKKVVLHVVQHLAPGGLETLVLDMLRFAEPRHDVFVVSLEGAKSQSLAKWAKLTEYKSQLHFLNKQPGFSIKTLGTL
ncbi:glycosyl transferase, partial [Vibrio alginolyticus]|nr:glycosyl transferase [Vibrio alginolyticus]MDW2199480.1 glycosyl transferase [Vibrio sp. 2084]